MIKGRREKRKRLSIRSGRSVTLLLGDIGTNALTVTRFGNSFDVPLEQH
jgi:hypothetical protein